jgi:hypothetical protein
MVMSEEPRQVIDVYSDDEYTRRVVLEQLGYPPPIAVLIHEYTGHLMWFDTFCLYPISMEPMPTMRFES